VSKEIDDAVEKLKRDMLAECTQKQRDFLRLSSKTFCASSGFISSINPSVCFTTFLNMPSWAMDMNLLILSLGIRHA